MNNPRASYTERELGHAEARDRAQRDAEALSRLRTVTFLAAFVALVLWDALEGTPAVVALAALGSLIVVFGVLVGRHRRARLRERREEVLRSLAEEGLFRMDRKWSALDDALPEVERQGPAADPEHPYALDLDVFGTASLTRLAGPVTSGAGRRTLRTWLLAPANVDTAKARQKAVRELEPALDFRLELAALGRLAPPSKEDAVQALTDWAEGGSWTAEHRLTLAAARILPVLVVGLGVLDAWRGAPPWWLPPLVLQIVVLWRARGHVAEGFGTVEEGAPALQSAGPQLRHLEEQHWNAPVLAELSRRLATDGAPAHEAVARLVRLADLVESRRGLFYALVDPILLLDIHMAHALDRWRVRWGGQVRTWLDALATMEALSALASLGHDHPDWSTPTWDAGVASEGAVVRAEDVGHPLLRPDACVPNDVEVGPAGTFLFVTGSNMSGKSTLLRAVGANVVLAGAGARVCARSLTLPPVRLWTSMRVDDSVVDGVSRFMAELLRVRSIVEAAGSTPAGDPPVLYLIDEMLQGTNTAERRVAARAVLRHLLAAGAIGGVTSHDLTLTDARDLEMRRRAFHFRERVESSEDGTRLSFDYMLRPGLATTRNALRLLEAVGLDPTGMGDPDEETLLDTDGGDES